MAHKVRRERHKFECGHKAYGKFCHFCKDIAAGRVTPKKMVTDEVTGQKVLAEAKPKYWQRAKCPFCGGTRVKKQDINAFSPIDAKEYKCTSFECGKAFNSEQVKEYEQVEVKERAKTPYNPRLTDD
jgi:hypothetical protein